MLSNCTVEKIIHENVDELIYVTDLKYVVMILFILVAARVHMGYMISYYIKRYHKSNISSNGRSCAGLYVPLQASYQRKYTSYHVRQ